MVLQLKTSQGVEYTPLIHNDWEVSTPAEQGLDPMLVVKKVYYDAAEQIAERFITWSRDKAEQIALPQLSVV